MQDKLSYIIHTLISPLFESEEEAITRTKEWIIDSYMDKFFETDTKVKKLCKALEINSNRIAEAAQTLTLNLGSIALNLRVVQLPARNKEEKKFSESTHRTFYDWLSNVRASLSLYCDEFEKIVIRASNTLHQTDWLKMKSIMLEDYILPTKRKKYVLARDELEKAKQMVKTGDWEETLNHIRPSIDLALTEKFGFNIRNMKVFLTEAVELGLLPPYELLYSFFDEGSKRLHKGKVHSPLDCQTAVAYVAKFIDQIETMDIASDLIEVFRQKHEFVERK